MHVFPNPVTYISIHNTLRAILMISDRREDFFIYVYTHTRNVNLEIFNGNKIH